jgi:LmbE family N-acetylglucosaminyl deacetylase
MNIFNNHLIYLFFLTFLLGCNNNRIVDNLYKNEFICFLNENSVIMFVGAHPDDESLVGPLLAFSADKCKKVCVVSATKGESGRNLYQEDLTRTLAEVRAEEFKDALSILNCEPIFLNYINGISQSHPQGLAILDLEQSSYARWRTKGDNKESMEQAWYRWTQADGDPANKILSLFEDKRPDIVLTFDPSGWSTSFHREHRLVNKATTKAVQEYNKQSKDHNISLFYFYYKKNEAKNIHVIKTSDLNYVGKKDYLKLSNTSKSCYESQYGAKGSKSSKRYIGKGKKMILLKLIK